MLSSGPRTGKVYLASTENAFNDVAQTGVLLVLRPNTGFKVILHEARVGYSNFTSTTNQTEWPSVNKIVVCARGTSTSGLGDVEGLVPLEPGNPLYTDNTPREIERRSNVTAAYSASNVVYIGGWVARTTWSWRPAPEARPVSVGDNDDMALILDTLPRANANSDIWASMLVEVQED